MTQPVVCNVLTRVSLKSSSIQSIAENVLRRPSIASGPAVYVASLSVHQFSMTYPEFSSLSRLCFRSTHCQYADWINTSSYNIIITHCRVEIMLNRCVGYLICYIHVQSKRSIKTYCIQFSSPFCSFGRYWPSHDNAKVIPLWQRHIVEVGSASSRQPSVSHALCLRLGHTGCGETRRQAACCVVFDACNMTQCDTWDATRRRTYATSQIVHVDKFALTMFALKLTKSSTRRC